MYPFVNKIYIELTESNVLVLIIIYIVSGGGW